jgi:hypothetical protein
LYDPGFRRTPGRQEGLNVAKKKRKAKKTARKTTRSVRKTFSYARLKASAAKRGRAKARAGEGGVEEEARRKGAQVARSRPQSLQS